MLIAIISDNFEQVHENIENNLIKELVILMVESEVLVNRKQLFKNVKYVIMISEEKGETGEQIARSKLEAIEINMDRMVKKQKAILDNMEIRFERFIRNRINEKVDHLQNTSYKSLNSLRDTFNNFENSVKDCRNLLDLIKEKN